ncbi:MAG: glycosyltransferase family 2 protein [Candidatus Woesearchaeota archaeon]
MPKLSVIIPVYNERETLIKLLMKVEDVKLGMVKKEIILVDDYSTDGTRDIIKDLPEKYKVIFHKKNRGKGRAIRTGLKYATGDIIVIQDSDLEYDPQDYKKLIKPILKGNAKVVYGSRFMKNNNNWAIPSHYVGNKILSIATTILFFRYVSDMETCYKMFTKDVLKKIKKLKAQRFDFEPEITAKIIKAGFRIKEVPINYHPRDFSEGKKINWKDGVQALLYLIKYRFIN